MRTLYQDLLFSIRRLRKSPGFTLAALATLALAICANAVVFSVMDALVLRPLHIPRANSLYALWRTADADAHESYPDYLDLRDRNRSFDGLVAFNMDEAGLDTGKDSSRAWVYEASGNYFDALGIQPYLGRFFHASDEHGPDSAPYVVLSYGYWHSQFQDDPGVLGRVVQVDKHPFTIIGVAPPEFHGTIVFFHPDVFAPIVNQGQIGQNDPNARGSRWVFMVMGHLKPSVTEAQAIADLNSIGADLEKQYPKDDGRMTFTLARPSLYGDFLGRPIRAFMTGLMLLSGLILLAACANLGSLFAARAADRAREVALRLALGSSRQRILRGLFTEAMLLSLAGGAVGLLGSVMLMHALSAWQPIPRYPIHLPVSPDWHVYVVALLLSLASGLLFGAVPVRQVLGASPYEVVKSGSAVRVGRRITLRDLLLVGQIAICAVLVTASIVAVRGLAHSLHNRYGFDPQNTMLVDTNLTMAGYSADRVPAMQKRMIDAVAAIPGVESVAIADGVPLCEGTGDSNVFTDTTADLRPANAAADPQVFKISPEYFHAAGTVLLSGRPFTWHDDNSVPRVAVVNQEFARRIFGSTTKAIGGYFKMPEGTRIQVVGIAEDGKYNTLTENPQPAMFLPLLQWPSSSTAVVVRAHAAAGDPENIDGQRQLGVAIRSTLRDLDAGLPLYIQTRTHSMDIVMFGPHMATISLGVLGVMGAMLVITGIFGMAAYSVSKRLKELGIRIAVGAQRREVLRAALGKPFKLLAFGSAAGLLLGMLAARVLSFIVYQATPRDPLVLGGAVLTMMLLGLLATWIPAQRALNIDPLALLREE
ncbi:MAG: ABC transporter permease [Terriglobales bacterium]